MNCDNKLRHVCLKDLDNYVKRYEYFSDFTEDEIALVQRNLDIFTADGIVIEGSYEAIHELQSKASLKLGYTYIINDFRSIYLDDNSNICGIEDNIPSTEYWVILHPSSENTFDSRVTLYKNDDMECSKWVVEYDITPIVFDNGTTNKGTITYLKDSNNNYAYYDFKNVRFIKTIEDSTNYYYTFGGLSDTSNTSNIQNAHLEKGASGNIFMGTVINFTLGVECKNNIFLKKCSNSSFDYGTNNNIFQTNIINCSGTVSDMTLFNLDNIAPIPIEFVTVKDVQGILYLDPETLTYQFTAI